MSTIRKLPYIEKALANLNETQATEAISYLNGAGVETALGWDDLGDEALLAFGHFEPFGTGLLVSDPNGSTAFIAYSTNAQTLREYDLDIESKTAKEIVEGLTIEELRRVLKDKTSSGGGTIDAETLAGLLDASEGVIADLNEAGDKVELHLEETVTTDATLSLGTNTDGDPTIVLGYKKPDGTELTSPVSLDKGAFNVQNNHVKLNGPIFEPFGAGLEINAVRLGDGFRLDDADDVMRLSTKLSANSRAIPIRPDDISWGQDETVITFDCTEEVNDFDIEEATARGTIVILGSNMGISIRIVGGSALPKSFGMTDGGALYTEFAQVGPMAELVYKELEGGNYLGRATLTVRSPLFALLHQQGFEINQMAFEYLVKY